MTDRPKWIDHFEKARALSQKRPETVEVDARAVAREVQGELFPDGKPPQKQGHLPFAPMPSDMCRVSPFFPLGKGDLGDRAWLRDFVITQGPWGSITFSGAKLSTLEESVLLALLALVDGQREKETEEVEGRPANTYAGPVLPILKLMGLTRGAANYKRLKASLDLLQTCRFEIRTGKAVYSISGPVAFCALKGPDGEIRVTLNPYFKEMFQAGRVALLDVLKRASLKGEVSKALYRFIESHRGKAWEGHVLTLAAALNLDLDLPGFKIKERIRMAVSELVRVGVLGKGSGVRREVVTLRPPTSGKELPPSKA
jgi:hypothetical protein